MKFNFSKTLAASLVIFLDCSFAFAQSNHPIEAGSAFAPPEVLESAQDNDSIFIKALKDHSYCCQVRSLKFNDAPYFEDIRLFGEIVPSQERGESEPLWDTIEEHLNSNQTRLCMIAPTDGSYAYHIRLQSGPTTNLKIHCAETTIFGGYNTVVNTINYLELNNIMRDSPVRGRLTATNTLTGATVVENYLFTVAAGGRTDIPLHDVIGTGMFGSLVISIDGPAGSVQANLSQYKVTSTSPFAFALISREKLSPR